MNQRAGLALVAWLTALAITVGVTALATPAAAAPPAGYQLQLVTAAGTDIVAVTVIDHGLTASDCNAALDAAPPVLVTRGTVQVFMRCRLAP